MCVIVCNTVYFSAPHRGDSIRCNGNNISHSVCGVCKVPVDQGLPVEEHVRAAAERMPSLLRRGDIGDILEPQEQLQRGREWYGKSQNFGLDSSSEYKTPGILRDLPTRSANNTPERHEFSRQRREQILPPDRKRRRVEEVH